MKKELLIGLMGLTSVQMNAQATAETAKEVSLTEANIYSPESTGSQTYGYFKYTAPEGKGVLLTISKESGNYTSFQLNLSGSTTDYNTLSGLTKNGGSSTVYPIKGGQTVYIIASNYNGDINFTASVEEYDVESGTTIDKAIDGTVESFNVFYRKDESYNSLPTYIKYTATGDDVLQISSNSSLGNVTIQEGVDGTPVTLNVASDYSTNTYTAKASVENGKTYYIAIRPYSALVASVKEVQIAKGSSYDVPFTATVGDNTLPKAVGKYWYKYTATDAGFAEIKAGDGVTLNSGTVKVYNSENNAQGGYSPYASVTGKLDLRFEVVKGMSYWVCVEKGMETTADETFSLNFAEAKAGDSFNKPIALEGTKGSTTVPTESGTFYYEISNVTIPAGKKVVITVDAPEGVSADDTETQVALFNKSYGSGYSMASGSNKLTYTCDNSYSSSDNTYNFIISWKLGTSNGFTFNYSVEELKQGANASYPLSAQQGDNTIAEDADVVYYQYTPSKECWLTVDPSEPGTKVSFPADNNETNFYDAVTSGFATKTRAQANRQYIIKLENVTANSTFSISEGEFAAGESIDNAIEVKSATADENKAEVTLPASSHDTWYKFVAPKNGSLTIASDIADNATQTNLLKARVGRNASESVLRQTVTVEGSQNTETQFGGTVRVKKDDVVYVNVVVKDAQKDKKLSFVVSDPLPGEDASNPEMLLNGAYTLPKADRSIPFYYLIPALEGNIEIATSNTQYDYFQAELFEVKADGTIDENNAVARSTTEYSSDYSQRTTKLTCTIDGTTLKAGNYIMKVSETYAETPITVSYTENKKLTGISNTFNAENALTINNGRISSKAPVTVFDLSGRKVAQGSNAQVPNGVYVIRANGKSVKVIVK